MIRTIRSILTALVNTTREMYPDGVEAEKSLVQALVSAVTKLASDRGIKFGNHTIAPVARGWASKIQAIKEVRCVISACAYQETRTDGSKYVVLGLADAKRLVESLEQYMN